MHSRKELENSALVLGTGRNTFEYKIVKVIGKGANSIVYEALYSDSNKGKHLVRLKECYPYTSNIKRLGDKLVWENEIQKEDDFAKFKNAYHKLLNMQSSSNISNSTAHTFDLFEANGTLYSIMDATVGTTFDNDKTNNLVDILKTVRALAKVVGEYHNNGYLHLDIKPSNFLTISETRELVILFDVDSVTSIDEIKAGLVKCVPFSNDWAAPEQLQVKIKKLCPATDIFSIGAVLFEKVMDRKFNNEDMAPFAKWEFDSEKFDKLNPKIKRLLTTIFHKTLSANIKRRYQSCDELIADLDEAIRILTPGKQYIIDTRYASDENFIGRNSDLEKIHELFFKENNIFIHSIGGMGKTELAKKYAEIYNSDFDTVVFCKYNTEEKSDSPLISALRRIPIENADYSQIDDREFINKELPKICDDNRLLIILDNFDVASDKEKALGDFLSLNCKKIITTRNDFAGTPGASIHHLEALPENLALTLFKKHMGEKTTDKDDEYIKKILKEIKSLTLAIPILAKQIPDFISSTKDLYEQIKDSLFNDFGEIKINKDGVHIKGDPFSIMRGVFNIVSLNDIQKKVLSNLYMLRWRTLTKKQYKEIACYGLGKTETIKELEVLNDLLERNIISVYNDNDGDDFVYLHPMIIRLICEDINPSVKTCPEITNYYSDYFQDIIIEKDDYSKQVLLRTIFCFYNSLDSKNQYNFSYVIEKLYFNFINHVETINIAKLVEYYIFSGSYKQTKIKCDDLLKMKMWSLYVWYYLSEFSSLQENVSYLEAIEKALSGFKRMCDNGKNLNLEGVSCIVDTAMLFPMSFKCFYERFPTFLKRFPNRRIYMRKNSLEEFFNKYFIEIDTYTKQFKNTKISAIIKKFNNYDIYVSNFKKEIQHTLNNINDKSKIETQVLNSCELDEIIFNNEISVEEKIESAVSYYENFFIESNHFGDTVLTFTESTIPISIKQSDDYVFQVGLTDYSFYEFENNINERLSVLYEMTAKYSKIFDYQESAFNHIMYIYAMLSLPCNNDIFQTKMDIILEQLKRNTIYSAKTNSIKTMQDNIAAFFISLPRKVINHVDNNVLYKQLLPYIKDYLNYCENFFASNTVSREFFKEWHKKIRITLNYCSIKCKLGSFKSLYDQYAEKHNNIIGIDYHLKQKS